MRATVFPSIDAFYAADERRRGSGELDFGCWWRDGTANVTYRVSAVLSTGEIYVVALSPGPGVRVGEVELVAAGLLVGSYAEAERLLDGWADVCEERDSLAWVRERLSAVRP